METKGTVTVAGHDLAYSRFGATLDVLLVHGIPTNRSLWHRVAPSLACAGLGVLTVDLMGYGASDKPQDIDLGIMAQAGYLCSALAELGWERGLLAGHDIGGGIVQLMVAADEAIATSLVLIDTIAYDSFPEPGIDRLKDPVWDSILGATDFSMTKGLAKGFVKGLVDEELVTPELVERYEAPFSGIAGRLAYLRAARALRTEELADRMSQIEALTLPTLVLWGEKDVFQPLRYGERLADAMPKSRLAVVANAGHFLPEDAPDVVAEEIIAMVRRTGSGS